MGDRDSGLGILLDLDGETFAVDEAGDYTVKFVVRQVPASQERPHGLSYSLTLHDENGARVVGFDNAHGTRRKKARQTWSPRPQAPAAEYSPLRVPRRGDAACGFLGRGSGVSQRTRSSPVTTLKVGIASFEQYRERTMAIVRGEYKVRPDEPKVWFSSIESFAKILSERNRDLLRVIAETKPQSLSALAKTTGRAKSNLSRTLKTLERYNLIRFEKGKGGTLVPRTPYTDVVLDLSLRASRKAKRTLVPV
jgi:predicted transcriptional regulator